MIEASKKELEGLDISFELTDTQRALLASAIHQEWFAIVQRLMEEEIRKLNVRAINTDAADEKAIVANLRVAKGAAMFYKGFIDRLNYELEVAKAVASGIGTVYNPQEVPSLID